MKLINSLMTLLENLNDFVFIVQFFFSKKKPLLREKNMHFIEVKILQCGYKKELFNPKKIKELNSIIITSFQLVNRHNNITCPCEICRTLTRLMQELVRRGHDLLEIIVKCNSYDFLNFEIRSSVLQLIFLGVVILYFTIICYFFNSLN